MPHNFFIVLNLSSDAAVPAASAEELETRVSWRRKDPATLYTHTAVRKASRVNNHGNLCDGFLSTMDS